MFAQIPDGSSNGVVGACEPAVATVGSSAWEIDVGDIWKMFRSYALATKGPFEHVSRTSRIADRSSWRSNVFRGSQLRGKWKFSAGETVGGLSLVLADLPRSTIPLICTNAIIWREYYFGVIIL